jgi:hypothetical protein
METISPELVLVDPELARRARAQLPDSHVSNDDDVRARRPPEPKSEPRRAPAPKLLLIAAGLLSFTLGVLLAPIFVVDDSVPRSQPQPSRQGTASELLGLPQSTGSPQRTRVPESRQSRRGTTRRDLTPRPRQVAPPAAPSPKARSAEGSREPKRGAVSTQLFVWLPSSDARYYYVQFLEGKRTVFAAWPTGPRVAVPIRGTFRGKRFAFTRGRYRWIVRPGLGQRSQGRYGEPIVRSVWVVRS